MKKTNYPFLFLFLTAIICLFTFSLLAQDTPPSTPPAPALISPWVLLIPIITPLIIAGIKYLVPKLPTVWLPIIAPMLGGVLDMIAHYALGIESNTLAGAALGLAGVGVRELLDQIKQASGGGTTAKAAVLIGFMLLSLTMGCTTTQTSTDPITGQVITNTIPDTVKNQKVVDALTPLVTSTVRRVVVPNPKLAPYFQSLGGIFCDIATSHQFSPDLLLTEIERRTAGLIRNQDALDVKDALVALYKINYGDRFNADVPPDEFAGVLCRLMCAGITQGLKDAATVSASWYWNPPGLPRGEMAFRGEIFQL